MKLGFVGLGRMGGNMVRRLLAGGHQVVAWARGPRGVQQAVSEGAIGATALEDVPARLTPPRVIWLMIPAGDPVEQSIAALRPLLSAGDVIVDGGNSRFTDSARRAAELEKHGIGFLDAGTSGGIWGLEFGYCLMVGGRSDHFRLVEPALRTLAPPEGCAHVGAAGAGHFTKMVHNAIEYAMLQAIGEGFECLERSEFDLDLAQIAKLWQEGAVVRSWLLELLGRALEQEGGSLARIDDHIDDSGTGRWTIEYAVSHGIPVPAISTALYERFDSRLPKRFAHQVIAALRQQFGGHPVQERRP